MSSLLLSTPNTQLNVQQQQVQELVPLGSALDFTIDYPNEVGQVDFKLWAAQIASGMSYLESKR